MNTKDFQHGYDWDGQDLTGYILTEKFNGCRAYWDGSKMWSRGGHEINIPQSWRDVLPVGVHFDGEIYDGVDGLSRCSIAVRLGRFTDSMTYRVFAVPALGPGRAMIETTIAESTDHALRYMDEIQARGGEGAVARHPNLEYRAGRTDRLLKLKTRTLRD